MSRETKTEVKKEFNDIGEKITITTTIQLKYEDMEVSQLPKNCYQCPVGFMKNGCRREVPLTCNGKPNTCKLKAVNLDDVVTM